MSDHAEPFLPVLVPIRRSPAELAEESTEIRELMKAVLVENTDYGVIPGTPKPTLFKSGAEWLLKWGRLGHRMEVVEVDRDHEDRKYGVTYRCTVVALGSADAVIATCDGYCGYDEPDREEHTNRWGKHVPRSPWNTIIKMAQKRALVGATLQATSTSGLFTQDMEDQPKVSAEEVSVADVVGPAPVDTWPAGFTSKAEASAAHQAMAARTKALPPEINREPLAHFREEFGWPMPKAALEILGRLVDQAEEEYTASAQDARDGNPAPDAGGPEAQDGPGAAGSGDPDEELCTACGDPIPLDGPDVPEDRRYQVGLDLQPYHAGCEPAEIPEADGSAEDVPADPPETLGDVVAAAAEAGTPLEDPDPPPATGKPRGPSRGSGARRRS